MHKGHEEEWWLAPLALVWVANSVSKIPSTSSECHSFCLHQFLFRGSSPICVPDGQQDWKTWVLGPHAFYLFHHNPSQRPLSSLLQDQAHFALHFVWTTFILSILHQWERMWIDLIIDWVILSGSDVLRWCQYGRDLTSVSLVLDYCKEPKRIRFCSWIELLSYRWWECGIESWYKRGWLLEDKYV